jgi:hypothetical protein
MTTCPFGPTFISSSIKCPTKSYTKVEQAFIL